MTAKHNTAETEVEVESDATNAMARFIRKPNILDIRFRWRAKKKQKLKQEMINGDIERRQNALMSL